jgi:AcrR family transcriptional regulator
MEAMAVEKWTRERRRQLTRDALLDAAAAVFARRGFEGASLEEIAETAGFTRGAIYKNFADKEELFLAVNDRFNERTLAEFAALLDETKGFDLDEAHIAAITHKWREMEAKDPDLYILGLEFNLYVVRHPELRERVVAKRHENARRVAAFMERQAAAEGIELPMSTIDLANIFLTTSDGFNSSALIDPEILDLYEPFLRLVMHGMAAAVAEHPSASTGATPAATA